MNNLNATGSACVTTELRAPDMSVEERGENNTADDSKETGSCHISKALSSIPVISFISGNGQMTDGQFLISAVTIVVISIFYCSLFVCVSMRD